MSKPVLSESLGALALALAVLQSGCVSARLAPTVVSYNLAVEQAQNEMLLLNIVRAAQMKPMYLTDISKITGSIKRDLTGSLTVPFAGVHHGVGADNSAVAGGTYSVNPTFDVNVLNTQEFAGGFLQPVALEDLAHFWTQGWEPELLLHLFVLEAEVEGEPDPYINRPRSDSDKNEQLTRFADFVTRFVSQRPQIVPCESTEEIPKQPVLLDKAPSLDALVTVAKEGLSVEELSDHRYHLKRVKKSVSIAFPPPAGAASKPSDASKTCPATHETGVALAQGFDNNGRPATVTLHLRSPEGVLYYLGEIVRLENCTACSKKRIPLLALRREEGPSGEATFEVVPIFVAFQQKGTDDVDRFYRSCGKPAVSVTNAEGDRYAIPRLTWPPREPGHSKPLDRSKSPQENYLSEADICDSGMSMNTLITVTQLIALHKSAKDFPSTGLVRVIGQ
jgi:hypothetical protein